MRDDVMRDEWAINRLLVRYCRYLDDGRYDDLAELFTPDGVLDAMGVRAEGRSAVREFFPTEAPAVGRPSSCHLLSNVMVDIDGDSARAESNWTLIQRDETGQMGIVLAGRYSDELQQIDGEWYLSHRRPVALARRRDP
jgi:3-phenylpropionate/cinnamic acid dioxygenase small subunit